MPGRIENECVSKYACQGECCSNIFLIMAKASYERHFKGKHPDVVYRDKAVVMILGSCRNLDPQTFDCIIFDDSLRPEKCTIFERGGVGCESTRLEAMINGRSGSRQEDRK